jgi:phage-related minor tail protein
MFAADGGAAEGGKPIIVGERGPEVFMPGKSGVIIPNEVMEAARQKRAQKLGRPGSSIADQLMAA